MTKLNVLVYDSISVELLNILSTVYNVKVFKYTEGIGISEISKMDLCLFHGEQEGHIHPDLYSETVGKYTDLKDDPFYERYGYLRSVIRFHNIPRLGIEEGAHYLTVQSGGSLIQYVLGHDKEHSISTPTGDALLAPSKHSQMMYPYDLPTSKFNIRAWSSYFESKTYLNGKNQERPLVDGFLEPEVVLYTNRSYNALAVQGSPVKGNKEYKQFFLNELGNLLNLQKG